MDVEGKDLIVGYLFIPGWDERHSIIIYFLSRKEHIDGW